jgi:hypothetical protein
MEEDLLGAAGVMVARERLDSKLQWSYTKNVWMNAGVRTTLYTLASPLRWAARPFRRR